MKILSLYRSTLFVLIVVAPHFASIDVADQAIFHSNKLIEDSKISVSFRAPSCSSLLWFVDSGSFYFIFASLVDKSVFECTCNCDEGIFYPPSISVLSMITCASTVHVYNCQAHQRCFSVSFLSSTIYRPASSFPLVIRQ